MDINISIIGLGYVGCISLACLSKMGFNVIGVDTNELKVNNIRNGIATIIEKDIDRLLKEGLEKKQISATSNIRSALRKTNLTCVCVNTPNTSRGDLDHSQIFNVAKEIGETLKEKNSFHLILIRSTVSPGTGVIVEEIIETFCNEYARG